MPRRAVPLDKRFPQSSAILLREDAGRGRFGSNIISLSEKTVDPIGDNCTPDFLRPTPPEKKVSAAEIKRVRLAQSRRYARRIPVDAEHTGLKGCTRAIEGAMCVHWSQIEKLKSLVFDKTIDVLKLRIV
jgi:hypothetical protein